MVQSSARFRTIRRTWYKVDVEKCYGQDLSDRSGSYVPAEDECKAKTSASFPFNLSSTAPRR